MALTARSIAKEDIRSNLQTAILSADGTFDKHDAFHIEMHLEAARSPADEDHVCYGGDSTKYHPKVCIKALVLVINGKNVSIPSDAYSDLGDPYWTIPELKKEKNEYTLEIHGGNRGWSNYTAILIVKGNKVIERRVSNDMEALNLHAPADIKRFK